MSVKKVVLCILDGWGSPSCNKGDAINSATTKCFDRLVCSYPSTDIYASGKYVGLSSGQCGNSEVGHLTIGAGRIIKSDSTKVSKIIKNKELKEKITSLISKFSSNEGSVHVAGIISDAYVHGNIDHFIHVVEVFVKLQLKIKLHLFLDGRDVYKKSAKKYIAKIENFISDYKNVEIATIMGRYYAMDRDCNFEQRTKLAYDAIVWARGEAIIGKIEEVIDKNYEKNITDEFIKPHVSINYSGIDEDNDCLFITNYRSDRIVQLLESLSLRGFKKFVTNKKFFKTIGMKEYFNTEGFYYHSLIKKESIDNTLGEILSKSNLSQLRVAETEKAPHVTFFMNGGKKDPFNREDRKIFDSIKTDDFSKSPQMKSQESTEFLISKMKSYDFSLINFAAPDIIGHTGNFESTIRAVEIVDQCIEKIVEAADEETAIIITSDHGNAEQMLDPKTEKIDNAHTSNTVPFIAVGKNFKEQYKISDKKNTFSLSDIAPTIIFLLGLKKADEITGESILEKITD